MQIARGSHSDDVEPAAIIRFRIKLDFVRDDDDRRIFATVRIQAQRANAARDHQPDITIADFILAATGDDRRGEFFARHRDLEQNRLGRIEQAINMFLEPEHAPVIRPNALKNPIAIEQPVIEHGHLGVLFLHILPIDKNFH